MNGFRLLDLELSAPIDGVTLSKRERGVGIIVRRCGRPVGFALHDEAAGASLGAELLARYAAAAAAPGVVVDALREELGSQRTQSPLSTVSIVICTHDRTEGLVRCLTSIERMRETAAHSVQLVEVVVVDNAPSSDATRRAVGARPWVRYALERKTGLDFARNCGYRLATGDFVAYLDDDVVVDAGWIDGAMRALAANPDVACLTGLVLPFSLADEAQVLFERRGGFRRGFMPIRWRGRSHVNDPIYPLGAGIFGAGANMMIRRTVLQSLGGFDEALDTGAPLPGGGDLDIFYRVVRAGHPLVYEPTMAVQHEHRASLEGLRRQYYSWGLGFFAFLGKVWKSDPLERPRIRTLCKWFTLDSFRAIRQHIAERDGIGLTLRQQEMIGALDGALGEYERSRRRSDDVRRTAR